MRENTIIILREMIVSKRNYGPSYVGRGLGHTQKTTQSNISATPVVLKQGWASFSREGPDLEKLLKPRAAR